MTPATMTPAASKFSADALAARLELLAQSDEINLLLDKQQAKLEAKRADASAAIAAIEKKLAVESVKANAAYEKADAKFKAALEAYRQAEVDRRAASYARGDVAARAEIAKRPHEKLLRDTADPAIHALLVEMSAAHPARPKNNGPTRDLPEVERDELIAVTERRLAAIQELEVLHLEPLSRDELKARLARIRRETQL